jgi:hypothetical protein
MDGDEETSFRPCRDTCQVVETTHPLLLVCSLCFATYPVDIGDSSTMTAISNDLYSFTAEEDNRTRLGPLATLVTRYAVSI